MSLVDIGMSRDIRPTNQLLARICDTIWEIVVDNNNEHGFQENAQKQKTMKILEELFEHEISSLQKQEKENKKDSYTENNDKDKSLDRKENGDKMDLSKLEEELRKSENARETLKESLRKSEEERDEEMKLVQEALEEAASERENMILQFEKELSEVNSTKMQHELKLTDDFEWKLSEMRKQHKMEMDQKQKEFEDSLEQYKTIEETEYRRRVEILREQLQNEWDEQSRTEIHNLREELSRKHSAQLSGALEQLSKRKDAERDEIQQNFRTQIEKQQHELETLQAELQKKENLYVDQIVQLQSENDQKIIELRTKVDQMQSDFENDNEAIIASHKTELADASEVHKTKIQKIQSQLDQLQSDYKQKMETHSEEILRLDNQHRINMERLCDEHQQELISELQNTKHQLERKHQDEIDELNSRIADMETQQQSYITTTEEMSRSLKDKEEQLQRFQYKIQTLELPFNMSQASSTSGVYTEDMAGLSRNNSRSSIVTSESLGSSVEDLTQEKQSSKSEEQDYFDVDPFSE